MKTLKDSVALAKEMVTIGENAGKRTVALITNMDIPLGHNIGNSLEVIANNTVILNTLTDETLNPYDKGELVSKEVNNSLLLEKQSEVRNCMIYSSVQDCKIYGRRASMMQQASREVWYLQERVIKDDCFSYFALKRFGTDSVSGERYRRAGYRTSEPLTAGNH